MSCHGSKTVYLLHVEVIHHTGFSDDQPQGYHFSSSIKFFFRLLWWEWTFDIQAPRGHWVWEPKGGYINIPGVAWIDWGNIETFDLRYYSGDYTERMDEDPEYYNRKPWSLGVDLKARAGQLFSSLYPKIKT